jgi:uncharacterized protein YlxP (DUF503 family)
VIQPLGGRLRRGTAKRIRMNLSWRNNSWLRSKRTLCEIRRIFQLRKRVSTISSAHTNAQDSLSEEDLAIATAKQTQTIRPRQNSFSFQLGCGRHTFHGPKRKNGAQVISIEKRMKGNANSTIFSLKVHFSISHHHHNR